MIFHHKSPQHQEVDVLQWRRQTDRKTDKQTDMATLLLRFYCTNHRHKQPILVNIGPDELLVIQWKCKNMGISLLTLVLLLYTLHV